MSQRQRQQDFPTLCRRVREAITAKYGKPGATPFLMLLDLVEILGMDKSDKVGDTKEN